jgi:AmmeMemoRadiSam system protein B
MAHTREPAVAGLFYPADPTELQQAVTDLLAHANPGSGPPKALVVPHAGYVYSGPVAASGYALLAPLRDIVRRVVLLGPAHRVAFAGLALPGVEAFATPLGSVPVDSEAVDLLLGLPGCRLDDHAHELEHSLEVHLPFLQQVLAGFTLVPLVVGDADADTIAAVLEAVWGGPETLIVISSDLSHYHDYATAQRLDGETTRAIEALEPGHIGYGQACGRNPLNGLLEVARRRGLEVTTVDVRNSGDTSGRRDSVVGYGTYAFH